MYKQQPSKVKNAQIKQKEMSPQKKGSQKILLSKVCVDHILLGMGPILKYGLYTQ